MGVISRDIISENFLGINLGGGAKFNKTQLELRIDKWKYFLAHRCDAKKGDKILIGIIDISVDFVALCFAAFELSLVIVIADEEPRRLISDKTIINPKMAQLMPLDILIRQTITETLDSDTDLTKYSRKIAYYKNNSKFEIDLNEFYDTEFPEDLSVISAVRPDENDVFMITTSSGTTGTAKVVKHTHKFFYEIGKRNSKEFSGNVVHSRNMHHGSSLTVFYLPSLMSDAVTTHYFTSCHPNLYEHFVKQIAGIDINHISFPYVKILRDVMTICEQQRIKFPNLRVSLLSYVPEFSKKYIRELYVKEIQSIFGSNETAGPLFLSTMSMDNIDNFDSRSFSKVDDFYDMQIEDDVLTVTMPVYGTKIKTNDVFTVDGEQYTHQGRSDLVRINDITIDFNFFNTICNEYNDQIMLLTDTVENKIYLLIDKNPALSTNIDGIVEHINTRIRLYYSTHRLQIDKYAVEDFSAFLSGVKIDRELIRGYFRQYV